jgi:hypothetical protein
MTAPRIDLRDVETLSVRCQCRMCSARSELTHVPARTPLVEILARCHDMHEQENPGCGRSPESLSIAIGADGDRPFPRLWHGVDWRVGL